jgi:hypothetical protein
MKNGKTGTRARSHDDGLTLDQQSAVDLLAGGKTDTETAAALNLNRVSVTRWRLYSPEFRAALAVRRAEIWGAAADRLRALIPKALDVLADALADTTNGDRVTVALAVLKLASPPAIPPAEPTDPDEYVRAIVKQERDRTPSDLDKILESGKGLLHIDAHTEVVRKRLAQLSAPLPKEETQPALEPQGEPR